DFPAPPQWSSALSRAELEAFYRAPHPGWRPIGPGSAPPSLGPIALPSAVFLTHVSDGLAATIAIGIPNPIDSGTLVAVTIVPRPPSSSPYPFCRAPRTRSAPIGDSRSRPPHAAK